MTFSRVKPTGWTDNIDTITGAQITTIDLNLSNALDGAAGGTYNPTSPIVVGGVGGMNITNGVGTVMTGPLTLSGPNANIGYRIDRTTIAPGGAPTQFTIDTSSDIYISTAPCAALCQVALNITQGGYEAPREGNRIIVRKHELTPAADVQTIQFHQDTVAGATIINLPALSALASPQSNNFVSVEFVFNGTSNLWEVVRCHPQCTP